MSGSNARTIKIGMGAFQASPVTYTRPCSGCDGLAVVASTCGPAHICDSCAGLLIAFIFGRPGAEFPAELRFPLDPASVPVDDEGRGVSCGLRADLPKKQRRHQLVYLGLDTAA